jgi:hypothetical protein
MSPLPRPSLENSSDIAIPSPLCHAVG